MDLSLIKKAYYDPKSPAAYGGVERLYRSLKEEGFTRDDIKCFLQKQPTYTLHRDRRYRFRRNRVVAFSKDYQWMADLVDMQKFSKENFGYKYILMVIDVFTKYAWARPITTKQPGDIIRPFQNIFELDGRRPMRLQTDRGKEFDNHVLHQFYEKHNISYFTSWNKTYKCSVVERLNRTIKGRMFRYFTANKTKQYVHVLKDIMKGYNNSYHRTIKMTPVEACNAPVSIVFKNTYGTDLNVQIPKLKFKKGDTVRIAYDKGTFDKAYEQTHTKELATVESINKRPVPMYTLKDLSKSEIVKRKFYAQELQSFDGEPQE